jgi:hypothetical protein
MMPFRLDLLSKAFKKMWRFDYPLPCGHISESPYELFVWGLLNASDKVEFCFLLDIHISADPYYQWGWFRRILVIEFFWPTLAICISKDFYRQFQIVDIVDEIDEVPF